MSSQITRQSIYLHKQKNLSQKKNLTHHLKLIVSETNAADEHGVQSCSNTLHGPTKMTYFLTKTIHVIFNQLILT